MRMLSRAADQPRMARPSDEPMVHWRVYPRRALKRIPLMEFFRPPLRSGDVLPWNRNLRPGKLQK